MQTLPPAQQGQKILIAAAHGDDETISAFAYIHACIKNNAEVKVILTTNGDAYTDSVCNWKGTASPSCQDYIELGSQRQSETQNALRLAGMTAENIIFLGYPDGMVEQMFMDHLNADKKITYVSPTTGCSRSPYPDSQNSRNSYCSINLLQDIQNTIEAFNPDIIIYPHHQDLHPDHRGTCRFVQAALAGYKNRLQELMFIVHQGKWPQPQGFSPARELRPPSRIIPSSSQEWVYFSLSPSMEALKKKAIMEFTTQIPVMGRFLFSFVRKNELFLSVNA